MTSFRYEAINPDGTLLKGLLEARDLKDASRELKRRGLTPVALDQAKARALKTKARVLGPRDRMLAIGELAMLVEAGVPLAEALPTLAERGEDSPLARAFGEMDRQLKRGRPILDALRAGFPELPAYVFQLVEAGAETGELASSLKDASAQMEAEDRLRQEMRNALTYPIVLVLAGVGAVLFIFTAVVPRFSAMFAGRMDELPALSRWVMKMGVLVNDNLIASLLGAAALVTFTVIAMRRPETRRRLFEIGLRVPAIGPWLTEQEIARWAGMMAKLLANKVALMRALELARGALKSATLAQQMSQVERMVRGGAALSRAISDHTRFDPTSLNLIRVGERAGQLPEMLGSLAALHERTSRDRLKRVLSLIEPAAILIIGGVIGVFVTAIILAITSVNQITL
jgi:general secretion pathway protein F